MKTAYKQTKQGIEWYLPSDDTTFLNNTAPTLRHEVTVTFDRVEGFRLAFQFLWRSLRYRRWAFYVAHEEPKP